MTSFTLLDPYEGWSEDQLKSRLSELCGLCMDLELIAANMGTVPGALDQLSPESRLKVKRIMDAYKD